MWVIVDLIQAARASQDLNILLQTLRGLGPLLFPFELVAQQVFEILEIPKSFSQFGYVCLANFWKPPSLFIYFFSWTTKAEPENPVMAGMMGAPQFSSTPLRLTSAKRSTTPRLPLDATTSTQDLTRPVLQWKPTNPNTNTTIANMSTGLGNVIPTQSLPSASASAPTLQLAMPLDHGDLGDLGVLITVSTELHAHLSFIYSSFWQPLRSSSVSASPTTGSKSKSDEPER